jgi:hypothetical protein
MNNKERVRSLLGFAAPVNTVEGALLDAGIDETGEYDATLSTEIKKVAIQVLYILLTTADTTSPEQMSIRYDRVAVQRRISALEDELGLSEVPTIRAKHIW